MTAMQPITTDFEGFVAAVWPAMAEREGHRKGFPETRKPPVNITPRSTGAKDRVQQMKAARQAEVLRMSLEGVTVRDQARRLGVIAGTVTKDRRTLRARGLLS